MLFYLDRGAGFLKQPENWPTTESYRNEHYQLHRKCISCTSAVGRAKTTGKEPAAEGLCRSKLQPTKTMAAFSNAALHHMKFEFFACTLLHVLLLRHPSSVRRAGSCFAS